jgi:hypothetical protein
MIRLGGHLLPGAMQRAEGRSGLRARYKKQAGPHPMIVVRMLCEVAPRPRGTCADSPICGTRGLFLESDTNPLQLLPQVRPYFVAPLECLDFRCLCRYIRCTNEPYGLSYSSIRCQGRGAFCSYPSISLVAS